MIMNAVDNSIGPYAMGSKASKFKLEGVTCERRNQEFPNSFLNFPFHLRMKFADSHRRLRRIPSPIGLHKFSRPNTASWLTHFPFSACFRDRRSVRIDF